MGGALRALRGYQDMDNHRNEGHVFIYGWDQTDVVAKTVLYYVRKRNEKAWN